MIKCFPLNLIIKTKSKVNKIINYNNNNYIIYGTNPYNNNFENYYPNNNIAYKENTIQTNPELIEEITAISNKNYIQNKITDYNRNNSKRIIL